MHQSVYAVADADKQTEIGKILHSPFYDGTGRIFTGKLFPGVRQQLFQAEGYPLLLFVDVENMEFEPVAFC